MATAPATPAVGYRDPHVRRLHRGAGRQPVPTSAWGSRRARQLCKRLAVAAGAGVAREQLIDLLWPDEAGSESYGRLGARLSVQLSTVRRILGGGVIADRESIRLDGGAVRVDLVQFNDAIAAGRFGDAVALRRGEPARASTRIGSHQW
jgi:DNA-binding SARP family transcriptional activator